MKSFILLFFLLLTSALAGELKIESQEVFKAVIEEMTVSGSRPEIFPLTEKYRLDLTLKDLIDQTTIMARDYEAFNFRLSRALDADKKNINFLRWFKELKQLASENEEFKNRVDKLLYMQFYTSSGVALLPEYGAFDLNKLKDRGKIKLIQKYNEIASDPEGRGILEVFSRMPKANFYTPDLTVAKLREIKSKVLKDLRNKYYKNLLRLYSEEDPENRYLYKRKKFQVEATGKEVKLFNTIQDLPNKHQLLLYLSAHVPGMPYRNSMLLLPVSFIEKNFSAIKESLEDYTFNQIIHSDDQEYIYSLRKWMHKNASKIEEDLKIYNHENTQDLSIQYKNPSKMPRLVEALFSQDSLLKLYPDAPWFKGDHGVIINRNGKHLYFDKNGFAKLGRGVLGLFRSLVKSENYLSLLAGTATLALAPGNIPVALGTRKMVKELVEIRKYDKEWDEFFATAPQEVINAFLLSSGFSAGRFYKILALGAGQGALQSFFTGQDVGKGALVGASLSLLQHYALPSRIGRPMSSEYTSKALAYNRRMELLERSVKGLLQGASVAALEGESVVKGSLKGIAFGYVSAKVIIWFLGTRYYPFKDFSQDEVDEMIRLENEFQNEVGRGGSYNINRQLILDANHRVGGVLPELIHASITLPGNVSMSQSGFESLLVLTHEAHHLMQQHQSGVFGFYLFRYIPTSLITGYNGHPDEHFLGDVF